MELSEIFFQFQTIITGIGLQYTSSIMSWGHVRSFNPRVPIFFLAPFTISGLKDIPSFQNYISLQLYHTLTLLQLKIVQFVLKINRFCRTHYNMAHVLDILRCIIEAANSLFKNFDLCKTQNLQQFLDTLQKVVVINRHYQVLTLRCC